MLSVHTSPLEQPGTGDAGGMNVYVLELSRALATRGVRVEVFTRATSSEQPETVVLEGYDAHGRLLAPDDARAVLRADTVPAGVTPPVLVHHVPAGPFEALAKEELPGVLCGLAAGALDLGLHRLGAIGRRAIVHHDLVAGRCKAPGDGRADATAGPSDEGDGVDTRRGFCLGSHESITR